MSKSNPDGILKRLFERRAGQPLELEDGRLPQLRAAALYVISSGIIAGIVWAAIAEVREVALARGEFVPVGNIQLVQHFEGGIVDAILAKAGNDVKAGEPIVRLKPRIVSSDINQLSARIAWLDMEEIRLTAELSQTPPDFSAFSGEYRDFVQRQQAAYAANIRERSEVLNAWTGRIAALKGEIEAITSELTMLVAEAGTHQEILGMQDELAVKARTTRRSLLEARVAFQRANTAQAAAKVRLAESTRDLAEAEGEKGKILAKTSKDLADQRAKNVEQRLELAHQLDKFTDRFERLLIRAPVDGFVKDIVPKGPGAVVQPGQLVAEIVPKGENLVAEVRIHPRDVGHISAGDPAELEVTTYDVNVHGKIIGRVTNVSASSFKGENGEPYFRGEVAFDLAAQDKPIRQVALIPGMVVEASIVTGSKSILRYLLKPIYRSLDRAFTER